MAFLLACLFRFGRATDAPTYFDYYATDSPTTRRPTPRPSSRPPSPTTAALPTPAPTDSPIPADTPKATWLRSPRLSTPPERRVGHTMQRMCKKSSCFLLVWGGTDGEETCFDDMYKFWLTGPAANTWQKITPLSPLPPARYSHNSATDDKYRMIIWGGLSCQGDPFRDVWIWNNDLSTWTEAYGSRVSHDFNPVRWLSGNFYKPYNSDNEDKSMLLFWGMSGRGNYRQWRFSLTTYSWDYMSKSCPGDLLCFNASTRSDIISLHSARSVMQVAPSNPTRAYIIDPDWNTGYVVNLETRALPGSTAIISAFKDYVLFLRPEVGKLDVSIFFLPEELLIDNWSYQPLCEKTFQNLGRPGAATVLLQLPNSTMPSFYMFGGEAGSVGNDLYKFILRGGETRVDVDYEELHPSTDVPAPRAYHSAVVLDGTLYIFGGRVGRYPYQYSSDLWKRSFAVGTKSVDVGLVEVEGEQPPGRAYHSAVAQGVRMIIFGGTNGDQYFADTWTYNLILKRWVAVQDGRGVAPTPRAGHAAVFYSRDDQPCMLVVGGYNQAGLAERDQLWQLNLETYVWKSWTIKGENKWLVLPSAVLYKNLQSSETSWYLVVGGGTASEYERFGTRPLSYLDLEDYSKLEWKTFAGYTDSAKLSGYRMGVFDSLVVRVGGRWDRTYSTVTSWAKDLSSAGRWLPLMGAEFEITNETAPGGRLGHTVIPLGDALAVFGGSSSNQPNLPYTANFFTNDLWLLNISTVSKGTIPCARGTVPLQDVGAEVYSGSRCQFCKLGTYYKIDKAQCEQCLKGRYGPLKGAVEAGSCLPCPSGSYASSAGQSACARCTRGGCNRIGSEDDVPDAPSYSNLTIGTPEPVVKTSDSISSQRLLLFIGLPLGLGACAIMTCIFFCCERRRHPEVPVPLIAEALPGRVGSAQVRDETSNAPTYKSCFQRFDWLHTQAKKRNSLGGCFTVLWIIAFVAWTLSVVIPVVFNNAIETRSILPAAFRGKKFDDKSVLVTITLSLSAPRCKCNGQYNQILPDKALGENDEKDYCHDNCTFRWKREKKTLKPGVYFVNFTFSESAMYAGSWNYEVRSSVGYDNQISSVGGTVLAKNDTVFRGAKPSIVSVALQELRVRDRRDSKEELKKGYLAELQSVTLGDSVDYSQFHDKNGVSVSFKLTVVGKSYVQITVDEKLALSVAVTIVLSILISAKSLSRKVLESVEVLVPFAIKVICCQCRSNDFKKLAVAMELGTLMDDYEEEKEKVDKQLAS